MLPTKMPAQDKSSVVRLVHVALRSSALANTVFLKVTACLQALILPQVSPYQMRVYGVTIAQVFSCDLMLVLLAKALQVYFRVSNFCLLLSVGSILPFLRTVYQLWWFIPCPPMASIISNVALTLAFVVLLMLGVGTYAAMGGWTVYCYIMTVWPWFVLMSMISRLYIERQVGKNPLSPVRELPILGMMSSFALALTVMAAKELSISDCIVVACLDPLLAALLASAFLGSSRRQLHFRNVKIYVILLLLIAVFRLGEQGPGKPLIEAPTYHHGLFAAARLLIVARSIFVKWSYASFGAGTKPPTQPQENGLLFYSHERPRKNRFTRFPAPALFTLDVIFDSGLRDSDFHAMGPLGTQDLLSLTEGTYLLPVSALVAWTVEYNNLQYGVLPPVLATGLQTTAVSAYLNATAQSQPTAQTCACCPNLPTPTPPLVSEGITTFDTVLVVGLLLAFCFAMFIRPWGAALTMFDRGSSVHAWKYQPIIIATPFFLLDVLFLNEAISKFQVVVVVSIAAVLAHFRSDLWTYFKRRYLLLYTQELHYYQPAVVRQLQRKTLLEFLHDTSTDDYGMLLLETAIRHGGNIRELARDTSVIVWDAAPTATAAWKLAFSLVRKSIRRQKLLVKRRLEEEREHERFVEGIVIEIVHRAVDRAVGHGVRLRFAGSLAGVFAKRRALRMLRALAQGRRMLRQKRRTGQLANAPAHLATAGGKIRSIREMGTTQSQAPQRGSVMPALPPPSLSVTARSGFSQEPQQHRHLSLTAQSSPQAPLRESSRFSVPGELPGDTMSDADPSEAVALSLLEGVARGVFWGGEAAAGSLVLAFGDTRRGQLGQEGGNAARRAPGTTIMPVEELRGTEPVQVEAAGVTSFVVGTRGQVWGFGSNRSMELGMRREMAQVNAPQRIKSVRDYCIVQVAGSCSASGQAHTLALTSIGQVHTFGTSACGALGHGSDIRQTPPLVLRLTLQVAVRQVCVGACHSLMVTDNGQLYAFGDNKHGQLGIGRRDSPSVHEPMLVEGPLASERVLLLAAGDDHTLASTESGALYAWGANANGQLGISRVDDQALPQVVRELQGAGITSLACGARHSLAVADRGSQVWAFGSNVQGQLGIGQSNAAEGFQLPYPTLCRALTKQHKMEIVQVVAAACHSLAVTRAGEVWAWGDNTYGQLGFPPEGSSAHQPARVIAEADVPQAFAARGVARVWVPTRIVGLGMYRIQAAATADMHSLVLAK